MQSDMIKIFLFDLDGRMIFLGSHLLIEDVFDIVGAIGIV